MLKSVFIPNRNNSFAWANVLGLMLLVALGKIEAYAVLFGYFLETILIGGFNIAKMYMCYRYHPKSKHFLAKALFFLAHYGGFVAIQSIFLFAIFMLGNSSFVKEPFNLISNYASVLQLEGIPYIVAILGIGQFLKYIFDFLQPKKYLVFTMDEVMFKPYFRIIIQQFVVILGGFFMILNEASVISALLLVLLRFIVDFIFVGIKENSVFLDSLVDRLYKPNGKQTKAEIRKALLIMTE